MTLVDTDVIIWYMRGNPRAADALERVDKFSISAVTYMELIEGMRNKREAQTLRTTLAQWRCSILPIDSAVSNQAMFYVEQYFHTSSLRLADALIGATAIIHNIPLLTANAKHYKVLTELTVRRFRP
ncbi:MAG: type II toxin-antitoxin system VapC family toxin [Burkholderiales bacterium]